MRKLLALAVPAFVACNPTHSKLDGSAIVIAQPPATTQTLSRALVPLQTCTDVGEAVKQKLETQANTALQKQLDQELKARKDMRDHQGDPCRRYYYEDAYGPLPATAAGTNNTTADDKATSYSTTNNQVANVEEADFMKNDAKYLYVLAEGHLEIFDLFPTATAKRVSLTKIDGELKTLLLFGDTVVVYSAPQKVASNNYWYRGPCTYGYDCDFSGDGQPTRVSILDVSDRAAPKLLSELDISSSYLTARGIGSEVHTAVQYTQQTSALAYTIPYDTIDATCSDDDALVEAAAKIVQQNKDKIAQLGIAALLPGVIRRDFNADGSIAKETSSVPCDGFFASDEPDAASVLSVVSFNVGSSQTPTITSVIGRPGPIYVSPNALYVASRWLPEYYWNGQGTEEEEEESSNLHKFSLTGGFAQYVASGPVRGHVLNQFAMDERDDFLRVASTVGHLPGPAENVLAILGQNGAALEKKSELGNIAVGEDIRSVRFDGERGFIVTFKKTDPLFYFDLSDPAAPKELGELKIPGFSTYMHLLDGTHLLTIGYDADDHGDFAFFDGVLLQIFDVTNPQEMTLAHKEIIGTRGSSSEALGNHLAFNYFAPKKMLALPMTICEGGDDGQYGQTMSFSGTMLYEVSAQSGFSLEGKLPVASASQQQNLCGNWWSQSSSTVRRTIFMDDTLWSVSGAEVVATDVQNASSALVNLSFTP